MLKIQTIKQHYSYRTKSEGFNYASFAQSHKLLCPFSLENMKSREGFFWPWSTYKLLALEDRIRNTPSVWQLIPMGGKEGTQAGRELQISVRGSPLRQMGARVAQQQASVLKGRHSLRAPNYLLVFNSDVLSLSNFIQNEFISFSPKMFTRRTG